MLQCGNFQVWLKERRGTMHTQIVSDATQQQGYTQFQAHAARNRQRVENARPDLNEEGGGFPVFQIPGLEIIDDPEGQLGRFIRTTVDLDAGTDLFTQDPFATVVAFTRRVEFCLTCHTIVGPFEECELCRNVHFCSDSPLCKMSNRTHRFVCGSAFEFHRDLDVKCAMQMVFETLVVFNEDIAALMQRVDQLQDRGLISRGVPAQRRTKIDEFDIIMQLAVKRIDAGRYDKVIEAYGALMHIEIFNVLFKTGTQKRFLQHLLAQFLGVMDANVFQTSLLFHRGPKAKRRLLYDIASFFNHSCSPNVIIWKVGKRATFTTCRKVQAGEQLYISYTGQKLDNTAMRRRFLLNAWGFHCGCERCVWSRNQIGRGGREITRANLRRRNVGNISYDDAIARLNEIQPWTPQVGELIMRIHYHLNDWDFEDIFR